MPTKPATGEPRERSANRRAFGSVTRRGRRGQFRYRARFTGPDSNRYSETFGNPDAARAWLNETERAIDAGKWKPPHVLKAETFGQYAAAWIATRPGRNGNRLAPKTRYNYERMLAVGLRPLHDLPLRDVTPAVVRTLHAERIQKGATQAGHELGLLQRIMRTALDDGLIDRNPVNSKQTRSTTGITHRPPTTAELGMILHNMPEEWRAAVYIAAYGGLRLSEWRALRRQDLRLNPQNRYVIDVHRQAVFISGEGWQTTPPKSAAGTRHVTLPSAVTPFITEHLRERVGQFPDALLFAPASGTGFIHDSAFTRVWNPARDAANVRSVVREHDLRAYYATQLHANGASVKDLQEALGDSTPSTALEYAKSLGRAAELAESLVLPPVPALTNVTPIRQKTATGM